MADRGSSGESLGVSKLRITSARSAKLMKAGACPESRERSCQIRCASVIRLSASPAGMPPNTSAGMPESTPQLQSPNAKAEAVMCHRTGPTSQAGRQSAKQSAEASDAGLKDLASGRLLFSKSITLVIAHIPIHCASAPCAVRRRRDSPSIR